jgi:adenylate kinase
MSNRSSADPEKENRLDIPQPGSVWWTAMRIEAVLLIGPTGAGKSPLGEALEWSGWNGRRCVHFDFGAELRRAEASPEDFLDLEAVDRAVIHSVLADGVLLEDRHFSIARKILKRFLRAKSIGAGEVVILNGLPRHPGQASALEEIVDLRRVVRLDASAEIIRERIRRNAADDRTGRIDDSPGEIEKRLHLFEERTRPLDGYCALKGIPIVDLAVSASSNGEDLRRDLIRACPDPA